MLFITHNIEEAVYLSERVLILSNKPATIKESLQNDLPYPRDISSQDFVEMRKHITDQSDQVVVNAKTHERLITMAYNPENMQQIKSIHEMLSLRGQSRHDNRRAGT